MLEITMYNLLHFIVAMGEEKGGRKHFHKTPSLSISLLYVADSDTAFLTEIANSGH